MRVKLYIAQMVRRHQFGNVEWQTLKPDLTDQATAKAFIEARVDEYAHAQPPLGDSYWAYAADGYAINELTWDTEPKVTTQGRYWYLRKPSGESAYRIIEVESEDHVSP